MTSIKTHRVESTHFVFYCGENSHAFANIDTIIATQESAYTTISNLLNTTLDGQINCWLCESDQQLSELADCPPYNGYAVYENGEANVYCVYNETVDATGYHEITHIIADHYNDIKSAALAEGLAVYTDRLWWSIPNELCVQMFRENGKYVSVDVMIDTFSNELDDPFYKVHSNYSYPIMGAFVGFLVGEKGIERFLQLYAYSETDWKNEFVRIYGKSLTELESEFLLYIENLKFDLDQQNVAKEILKSLL